MEITNGPTVEITMAGARVVIPSAFIAEAWLEQVRGIDRDSVGSHLHPRIGDAWRDGVYAGIARGVNGAPDYHLIVMPQADSSLKWQAALDWATTMDSAIPTRRELALCFANVPELFEKCAYWSSEQYAGHDAYAWYQGFSSGSQDGTRKDVELRARAVRRLPIR